MWSIVIFANDNSVAAVPSNWYRNGKCAWPKKSAKKRSKMIEIRSDPNSLEFDYFVARQLPTEKPIESLKDAREKALKAQITSDLSSTEEFTPCKMLKKKDTPCAETVNKKLKPSLPTYSSSEGENDDRDEDKTFTLLTSDSSIITAKTCGRPAHVSEIYPLDNISEQSSSSESKSQKKLFGIPVHKMHDKNGSSSSSKDLSGSQSKTDEGIEDNNNLMSNINDGSLHNNKRLANETVFQNYVKTSLVNLKYELKTLSYSVDAMKTMLQNFSDQRPSEFENYCDDDLLWPILNHEQLENIENSLDDPIVRKNETIKLSRLVGLTVPESVRRIMSRMFDDQFIKHFSFIGFKGKNKFSGLKCCRLLFDSIRKNKKFDCIPDKDIALITARYMAQATNRLNKKKKEGSDKTSVPE